MSENEMLGTPGEGHTRRKPSYSEVVKTTPGPRPAPINTNFTRAVQSAAKDTSTTASSSFWSPGNAPPNTGYTVPTPLFSPSIWSPVHQGSRSATLPRKDHWETTMKDQINEVIATKTGSPRGTVGLGVELGNGQDTSINTAYTTDKKSSSPYKYSQEDIASAQIKPYVPEGGVHLSKTAPIVQQPFTFSVGGSTSDVFTSGSFDSMAAGKSQSNVDEDVSMESVSNHAVLYITSSDVGSDGSERGAPGIPIHHVEGPPSDQSFTSEISETGESEARDQRMQAPMIAEEPHPQNFIRTLMDGGIPFSMAFDGADAVCTAINPSHYAMEYGSRVICIKTDFVENIHWAIKSGRWVVMDRVANRIMEFWKARSGKKDKVLLVFSVNGQKSYCGLAEMSGPFELDDSKVEGFKMKKEDGAKTWGTMPITWIFIKNVSYHWFRDIKNSHSNQDVANMWNGMHYPSEIAREVVERIIARPHFTNVLAWRQDQTYDPFRPVLEAAQIDPLAIDAKKRDSPQKLIENGCPTSQGQTRGNGSMRGAQSNRASALSLTSWRRPSNRRQEDGEAAIKGKTASFHHDTGVKQSSTPPNLDGHISPRPKQGQLVMCKVDSSGNLIPVTPNGGKAQAPIASSKDSLINQDTPRRGSSALDQSKARSTSSRGGFPSFRGGRGGNSRGSFRGVSNTEGAYRVSSTPPLSREQQSRDGPQIRRMKSDIGLEDPFGTPRTTTQGTAVPGFVRQSSNTHTATINNTSGNLQHAASTAIFVPHSKAIPVAKPVSVNKSTGLTVSHGNGVSSSHAGDVSGGVMLQAHSPQSPVVDTPSRPPGQTSIKADASKRDFTPTGHQIYPSPIDQAATRSPSEHVSEKKSNKSKPAAEEEVTAEYENFLIRQQTLEAELMSIKFQKAGLPLPENLKTAIAAGAKRAYKSSNTTTSPDSIIARSVGTEVEEVQKTKASEKVLRWDALHRNIENLVASEYTESVKARSDAGVEPFVGFESGGC